MNGCSYLCSARLRRGAPRPLLQVKTDCLAQLLVHCPLSIVQRPLAVTRSSQYLHHVSLHSYTHKCRPLTYAAVLALTGRAPAVLFLLHLLPVSTNSLTRATTAALWPVVVCSPTLTAGPAAEFCCKFACLCRAHQQFRNSTVAS